MLPFLLFGTFHAENRDSTPKKKGGGGGAGVHACMPRPSSNVQRKFTCAKSKVFCSSHLHLIRHM